MSVDLSVPFTLARTVSLKSFSRVNNRLHFNRSAVFVFCTFPRVPFFFPASWLIGSHPRVWSWLDLLLNRYRPSDAVAFEPGEQMLLGLSRSVLGTRRQKRGNTRVT